MKRKKFHTYKCSKHQSLTCIHPQRFRLWLYTRLACSKFHSCCLLIEMASQFSFGQLWTKSLSWTQLPSFYLQRREHFWICKGKYGKWNWHAMQLSHYPWCGYPWTGQILGNFCPVLRNSSSGSCTQDLPFPGYSHSNELTCKPGKLALKWEKQH